MSNKVITGRNTRWSYANVWEPKSINGGTPKYSVSLIIPKNDIVTIEKIKKAIEFAYKEGESKLKVNSKTLPALSAIKIRNKSKQSLLDVLNLEEHIVLKVYSHQN